MTHAQTPALSIILPVLNEAEGIVDALRPLQELRASCMAEVIVVDGGSHDETMTRAKPWSDAVMTSRPGRGRQVNAGATKARGNIFLFLHADTRLPVDAPQAIENAVRQGAPWGRFDVIIAGSLAGLSMVATLMNWRSRLSGIATGDQAIFMTRDMFLRTGGFPEIPLMEDVALSSMLRRLARPACLRQCVVTSGRRWEKHGLWRTIVTMWWLRLRFYLGADPIRLAREYGYAVAE
jgi:rSAM/selenodomain-associated transferase 2